MKVKVFGNMTFRLHMIAALALMLVTSLPAHSDALRSLTDSEAHQLAKIALDPSDRSLPGFDIESHKNPDFPNYIFYIVTWGEPRGETGGTVTQLAIDEITGDVWSGVVCREVTSPILSKLQWAIRKRIGLSHKVYKALRRKGPMCE